MPMTIRVLTPGLPTVILFIASLALADELKQDPKVVELLESIRARRNLPGMIGGVLVDRQLVAVGAVGVRKLGADEKMTIADRVHLGSCTKAMTATRIAMLVESGKLRWDSTLAEVFPDLKPKLHEILATVTLVHLLTHRSGLPADGPWWQLEGSSTTEKRRNLLQRWASWQPPHPPGTKFEYSNAGYAFAGLMAEQTTGKSWEDLMTEGLFQPLGMQTAGFGSPGAKDKIDQPWGHTADGKPSQIDNAPPLGPAGTVHCSLPDWAKFVTLHLRGAQGQGELLKPETFRKLHTPLPENENYAFGWAAVERPWASGAALTHSGSNSLWYATVWVAPQRNFATLVAINQGGDVAAQASNDASGALIQLHLQAKP
jgi:CubicO group peptidase (beta-lactamase class C family)